MKYNHSKIEKKWQAKWRKERVYEPAFAKASDGQGRIKFYNLMMFPYPSAEGLHVGNMYAFVGSDIYGRYQRMLGKDVFEPIGLDGFGIHSENYALKIGKHPADQAKISEKRFYKQLEIMGNGFAWQEKLETYDPEYYRWTQWIFTQMFKNGLAYRKKQAVNWCLSCLTVLADEQVINGECERCGTKVIKKDLEQWFFKITDYAERLLNGLNAIDWSEKVKIAQRNWIGKSEGALVKFKVESGKLKVEEQIEVFTTRPDTLFGATYLVLAPEHFLIKNLKFKIENWPEVERYIEQTKGKSQEQRITEGKEKTGVELKGVTAVNPANQQPIPVWVADYVFTGYGTGAIMAVPAHDEKDWEFAEKYKLPVTMVICPNYPEKMCPVLTEAYLGEGYLVASGKFDGMDLEKAKWAITEFVGGKKKVQYKLRDWLISRQRYWGPPIPMIYCDNCEWQAVPEKDLPVLLPKIKDFRPTGTDKSPLAAIEKFVKTKCPKCGGAARRETDASDTFLDSAWYYLGYLILGAKSEKRKAKNFVFPETVRRWCPVDMYIGGAEHAVLHLLYVRFLAMALYDWRLLDFEEPATKFRAHGLLIKDGAKMSKSKGNVVNPDEYIKKFGADVLRMYLMFLGPFEQGGDFRDESIAGIVRFLARVWKLKEIANDRENDAADKVLHKTIKKVGEDIASLNYNTAISQLMILIKELENGLSKKQLEIFLKLLAPFAPHIAEEMWRETLKQKKSIHLTDWPEYDEKLLEEDFVDLVVQINGKVRGVLKVARGTEENEAKILATSFDKVKAHLAGKAIKKVIFVPDRLINLVIE